MVSWFHLTLEQKCDNPLHLRIVIGWGLEANIFGIQMWGGTLATVAAH